MVLSFLPLPPRSHSYTNTVLLNYMYKKPVYIRNNVQLKSLDALNGTFIGRRKLNDGATSAQVGLSIAI